MKIKFYLLFYTCFDPDIAIYYDDELILYTTVHSIGNDLGYSPLRSCSLDNLNSNTNLGRDILDKYIPELIKHIFNKLNITHPPEDTIETFFCMASKTLQSLAKNTHSSTLLKLGFTEIRTDLSVSQGSIPLHTYF